MKGPGRVNILMSSVGILQEKELWGFWGGKLWWLEVENKLFFAQS